MWSLAVLSTAWAVECGEGVSSAALDDALARAERAFADLDESGFRDATNEVSGLILPCLADPIAPEQAARVHRVLGIRLFTVGDEAGAAAALASAILADPDYVWDEALLPSTHPLRSAASLEPAEAHTRKVPEPRSGSLAFDGQPGLSRPVDRPTVLQRFDADGSAAETTWLGPSEPLPAYPAIPKRRNALLACAASTIGLGGAAYGVAWASRGGLFTTGRDPSVPGDELDALRFRTNALTLASGALVVGGGGCAVGAALTGAR